MRVAYVVNAQRHLILDEFSMAGSDKDTLNCIFLVELVRRRSSDHCLPNLQLHHKSRSRRSRTDQVFGCCLVVRHRKVYAKQRLVEGSESQIRVSSPLLTLHPHARKNPFLLHRHSKFPSEITKTGSVFYCFMSVELPLLVLDTYGTLHFTRADSMHLP
jgi:hypothetical protein